MAVIGAIRTPIIPSTVIVEGDTRVSGWTEEVVTKRRQGSGTMSEDISLVNGAQTVDFIIAQLTSIETGEFSLVCYMCRKTDEWRCRIISVPSL